MTVDDSAGQRLSRRLNIVVPYRDRESHLREFAPWVSAYFDRLEPPIDYRVTIVEQEDGLPFNRGALMNAGFLLGEAWSDYACLHDVDYLPVDADYSWADRPTPILWYGAEQRPVAPGVSDRTVTTNLESSMGGVLLMPNAVMRQVDGYSNGYWGWGYEDFDFSLRIRARQLPTSRRKGRFQPLDHRNDGFTPEAAPSPISLVNRRVFQELWSTGKIPAGDGLSSLAFEVLDRRPCAGCIAGAEERWEIVRVRFAHAPRPDQAEADRAAAQAREDGA
ncbi:galactosyltransferase [Azospirillum sp. B510]|uniref:galactosyltransferase-related protein n=1 Tax=Azospirillum sp. (strain B510) TaxID=137722 RepID=UPI0001C4C143|nr:galactosyltransferase-related protein [Azospirillum sp. B510]BAI71350.1 galactosyltransferase [Azospirillum sp. B510]